MSMLESFADDSRVWIYQSHRTLTDAEVEKIKPWLQQFTAEWVSHNRQLKAWSDVLHNRFLVLAVDEHDVQAGGCSIDRSVAFVKELGRMLSVDFFDRFVFSFRENGLVKTVGREEFAQLYSTGKINDQTIVFDNLVSSKMDFAKAWEKPLSQSWMKRFV